MKWNHGAKFLAVCMVLLAACQVEDRVAGGSSDETRTKITIAGRVVDEQSRGIKSVSVKLSQLPIEVVTDSSGVYRIPKSAMESLRQDTLRFFHNGLLVSSLPIQANWTQIPDLILFQREIAGTLGCADTMPASATAFIEWNGREVDSVQLVLDPVQNQYSTFVWIGVTDTAEPFDVHIDFRDSTGTSVSRSPVQHYPRMPENIIVPEFGCFNGRPQLAPIIPDTVFRGETVLLRSMATSTLGLPLKIEWMINENQGWIPGSPDTLIKVPTDLKSNKWTIRIRAKDSRGVSDSFTIATRIGYRLFEFGIESDSFQEFSDSIRTKIRFKAGKNDPPMMCRIQYGVPENGCVHRYNSTCGLPDPTKYNSNDTVMPQRYPSGISWISTKGDSLFPCADISLDLRNSTIGLFRTQLTAYNLAGDSAYLIRDIFLYPKKPEVSLVRLGERTIKFDIHTDKHSIFWTRTPVDTRIDVQWGFNGVWQSRSYYFDYYSETQNISQEIEIDGNTFQVHATVVILPEKPTYTDSLTLDSYGPAYHSDTAKAELLIESKN